MMDRNTLALLIVILFALAFCVPVSQHSERKDKIRGGILARVMHLVGVTLYLGVIPSALVGSLLVGPLEFGIPLALICLALALLALFLYGVVEKRARQGMISEDRGWTAKDARSSGL